MSPMIITPKGAEVLEESGFIHVIKDPENRKDILEQITMHHPQTKLDVESHAVVAAPVFLEKDFMNPVKTYLYNNPNIRETFAILAGIYIRDEFLKDHPEIVQ